MNLDYSRSRDISRGFSGILVSASEFSNHFIQSIRSAPKGTESSPRTHIPCHVHKRRPETRRVTSESEAGACSVDCPHARSESFEGSRPASVTLQDALIRPSTWFLSTAGASRWMW